MDHFLGGGPAVHRVLGSVGLVAAARTAFVVTTDHNNPERRFFLPLKNNISEDKQGLSFSIQKTILDSGIETSQIAWEKDYVQITADEATSSEDQRLRISATREAEEFLRKTLKNGSMTKTQIDFEAEKKGIFGKPLRTASERMKISKNKLGYENSHWVWSLPEDAQ